MQGCSGRCACAGGVPGSSLYSAIEMDRVVGINEKEKGKCREVIKRGEASKEMSLREMDLRAYAKTEQGLVINIPFLCKVSLSKIEIGGSFKKMEVVTNNRYVSLTSALKNSEEYSLDGSDHIFQIVLPSYKYKSVDFLTLRLQESEGRGSIFYLCICGAVVGALPKAVNVSYELYPIPEKTKEDKREAHKLLR